MKSTILVVDDDKEIRKGIGIYLTQEGYEVLEAGDGLEALEILENKTVHLIILDIMMPNLDGTITTYRIRQSNNVPILMLSAKNEEIDKIQGLQVGADDYLTKPFSPMELLARVRSLLRRYMTLGEFDQRKTKEGILQVGGITLDKVRKEVEVEGTHVKMTPKEFQITQLLMEHPGRVFSIDEIYEKVWQEPSYNVDNTVSVHIRKIREKIEVVPKEPKYLKVVWGVGYKMEE